MRNTNIHILVTNDDGFQAKGYRKLISLMKTLGDVTAISTEEVMSAKGHSITTHQPLHFRLVESSEGFREYVCDGTPVDCVKVGYQRILERIPDIVVSGINHGSNASINVIYSGTMGAVVEACMDDIPAVGFSLECYDADADFDHLDKFILAITKKVLADGLPEGLCLNVNFPKRCDEPIKGVKICRQAKARWAEAYMEHFDADGKPYYDLAGEFVVQDDGDDTDLAALQQNYASLVPTHFDWTAKELLESFKTFENL